MNPQEMPFRVNLFFFLIAPARLWIRAAAFLTGIVYREEEERLK